MVVCCEAKQDDGTRLVIKRTSPSVDLAMRITGATVSREHRLWRAGVLDHLHVHVVPRTKGDGLRGFFWPRTKYAPGEAASVADRLRNQLA